MTDDERRRAQDRERARRYRERLRAARPPAPKAAIACGHCGQSFVPVRSTARYCSGACRAAAHRRQQQGGPDAAV